MNLAENGYRPVERRQPIRSPIGRNALRSLLLLSPLGALLVTGAALSQEGGGVLLTFDLSSALRYNDNLGLDVDSDGDSWIWDNNLGFTLSTKTDVDELTLSGGGVLRYADLPNGNDSGFEDPRLRLGYTRDVGTSKFKVGADWRRSDLRYLDPMADEVPIWDLTTGELVLQPETGTREIRGGSLSYETGIGGPLGLTLDLSRREVSYQDAINPKYYDNTTNRAGFGLRMDLSPVLTARVWANGSNYTADNTEDTDRKRRAYGLGLDYDADSATRMSVSLGRSRVNEVETIGGLRETDVTKGATGSLEITRDLVNGQIGAEYARDITSTGRHDRLSFSRDLQLRDGNFAGMLGATRNDSGDVSMVADVSWSQTLPRGNWSLSLSRAVYSDDDDEEDRVVTRLSAGYSHQWNALNGMNLGLGLYEVSTVGTDETDRRVSLSAAWQRTLTEDANLSVGYTYTWLDEAGATDAADSNAVYVQIGKRFNFRP